MKKVISYAFCKDKEKISDISHPNLETITGDVMNITDVKKAIRNMDVVIITLGSGKSKKSTVRSEGTKNIIASMSENGLSRLICQSTLGTYESNENLNFFWK